jgi:hypothetical protein
MAALLLAVLIPPGYLCGFVTYEVARNSSFGAVGTAFARWRYQERFESQHAELLSCLDQRLTGATGEEAMAVAEQCFAEAERRGGEPFAIHLLATTGGALEWQSVRYVDSSYRLDWLHDAEWSDGLHLVSIPCASRGLLYVRYLPALDERSDRVRGYSVLVHLRDVR